METKEDKELVAIRGILLLPLPPSQGQKERGKVFQLPVEYVLVNLDSLLLPPSPQDQDAPGLGYPDPDRLLQQSMERLPPAAHHKVVCKQVALLTVT